MHSASKCTHSALMKYFYYALKVASFHSALCQNPTSLSVSLSLFKYKIVDVLFNSWYFYGSSGCWILG